MFLGFWRGRWETFYTNVYLLCVTWSPEDHLVYSVSPNGSMRSCSHFLFHSAWSKLFIPIRTPLLPGLSLNISLKSFLHLAYPAHFDKYEWGRLLQGPPYPRQCWTSQQTAEMRDGGRNLFSHTAAAAEGGCSQTLNTLEAWPLHPTWSSSEVTSH